MLPTLSHFKIEQQSSPVCLQVWSPLVIDLNSSICFALVHLFMSTWRAVIFKAFALHRKKNCVSSLWSLEIFVIWVPRRYILFWKSGKSERQSRWESSDILDEWMVVKENPQWKGDKANQQCKGLCFLVF